MPDADAISTAVQGEVCNHHRIIWRLFYGYDPARPEAAFQNCVVLRERILSMAWKALQTPFSSCHVTITGGEPALHPALGDLVHYLLSSRRNVVVSIESLGIQPLQFYSRVLTGLPEGQLRFTLSIHPESANLKAIMLLIAAIVEKGQHVLVKLTGDAGESASFSRLFNTLGLLRQKLPFGLEIQPTSKTLCAAHDGAALLAAHTEAMRMFAEISGPENVENPLFTEQLVQKTVALDENGKIYRCQTPSILHIDPDGSFYGAHCRHVPNGTPLWEASDAALAELFDIIECEKTVCPWQHICSLTQFASSENANSAIIQAKKTVKLLNWSVPSFPNPLSRQPSLADLVRYKLRDLGLSVGKLQDSPLANRFDDVCLVYAKLVDNPSRQAFLRCIVDMLNGENGNNGQVADPDLGVGQVLLYAGLEDASPFKVCVGDSGQVLNIEKFIESGASHELEEYISSTAGFCSSIVAIVNNGTKFARTTEAIIYDFQPRLRLALAGCAILDVPLWFADKFPQYHLSISFSMQKGMEFAAIPQSPVLSNPLLQKIERPLFSILLYADITNLERALDSILIQQMRDFEICVLDVSQGGDCRELVSAYAAISPMVIRYAHFSGGSKGEALNALLEMSIGRYILFMGSDDLLSSSALSDCEHALAENATLEIICMAAPNKNIAGENKPIQNIDFMFAQVPIHPYGVAVARELLVRSRGRFADSNIYSWMPLFLRAFYHARAIHVLSRVVYHKNSTAKFANKLFADFIHAADTILEFYDAHSLDMQKADDFIISLFKEFEAEIKSEIEDAGKKDGLVSLINADTIRILAKSRSMLMFIIENAAIGYCQDKNLKSNVAETDRDWQAASAKIKNPVICIPVDDADNPIYRKPLISIIMPNYNKGKWISETIASILDQSFSNFELIVIDDASTDNSLEILRSFAQIDSRIRLYRMLYNVRQGICRNFGMDKALGEYVVFVDSDDLCMPDFFAAGMRAMLAHPCEIAIYSSEHLNEDNVSIWKNSLEQGLLNYAGGLREFFKGGFEPAPWAKIYKLDFLRKNAIRFAEYIYHQDVPFFYDALRKAGRIRTYPEVVYQCRHTDDSSIRPNNTTWLHLHSSCRFMACQQGYLNEWENNNLILGQDPNQQLRWHIENIFLERCAAFKLDCGCVPIPDDDYGKLAASPAFLRELLRIYARHNPESHSQTQNSHPELDQKPIISLILSHNRDYLVSPCLDAINCQALKVAEVLLLAADEQDFKEIATTFSDESTDIRVLTDKADILAEAKGQAICHMDSTMLLKADALLHAIAMLACHEDAACLVYAPGSEQASEPGRLVGREKLLKAYLQAPQKCLVVFRLEYLRKILGENSLDLSDYAFKPLLQMGQLNGLLMNMEAFSQSATDATQVQNVAALDKALNMAENIKDCLQKEKDDAIKRLLSQRMGMLAKEIKELVYKLKEAKVEDAILLDGERLEKFAGNEELCRKLLAYDVPENEHTTTCAKIKMIELATGYKNEKDPLASLIVYVTEKSNALMGFLENLGVGAPELEVILAGDEGMDNVSISWAKEQVKLGNANKFIMPVRKGKHNEIKSASLSYCKGKYFIWAEKNIQDLAKPIMNILANAKKYPKANLICVPRGKDSNPALYQEYSGKIKLCAFLLNLLKTDSKYLMGVERMLLTNENGWLTGVKHFVGSEKNVSEGNKTDKVGWLRGINSQKVLLLETLFALMFSNGKCDITGIEEKKIFKHLLCGIL